MKSLLPILMALAVSPSNAGLADRKGVWDLDSTFDGYFSYFTPLNASSLTAGTDYSFGTDGSGYTFLQTQPFSANTKRLTVTNPSGVNGGPGATRTNQWTVVMDVKMDALQTYAGLLQLDPANSLDVTFYLFSSNDLTAVLQAGGSFGTTGSVSKNAWTRIAITCGNNGAGGPLTLNCYLNGVFHGTKTGTFNGVQAMQPTFHLLSDNTAGGTELKPAKLGSVALWGETLSAADIASLGGPQPGGILPPGLVDAGSPPFSDSTIAPTFPYAHGANIGWLHLRPSADWGVVIGEASCSGFAHSANCGWINFGDGTPANGIGYGNTDGIDSGVNHDGYGNLSGLAWGANIGWINFGTDANGTPRPTTDIYRPRFDFLTGQFSGYAYGANIGWINLSTLQTATLAIPDTDGDGLADAWERQNFSYITRKNGTADTDGDGVSDKNEYVAGTDPNAPDSAFRIISQTLGTGPTFPWNITFTSNPTRVYRVDKSTSLGSWMNGPFFTPSSGPQTTTGFTETRVNGDFLRIAAAVPLQP